MKNIIIRTISLLCFLLALSSALPAFSQGNDAGIRITSGNKVIYEDLTILKDMFDEVYAQKKSEILAGIKEYIRKNCQSVSGLNAVLQEKPVTEIVEENNKAIIRYTLRQNYINFGVAREDDISLNNRAIDDSHITVYYDIIIDFEAKQDWVVDDLRFRKGIWSCEVAQLAVGKGSSERSLIEYNKSVLKNSFPIEILGVFGPLMAIQSSLNESIVSKIQKNEKLIQEMAIDEDRKIQMKADPVNNVLVIDHPYSSLGRIKREAKQNPTSMDEPAKTITGMQPKTTTSAAEINKPAAVNQAATIKKTMKGIH